MTERNRLPHARYGFTLIELLVVISIIALLVAILLPALGAARKAAQDIACGSNQRQIGMAAYAYGADHNNFMGFAGNATNPGVVFATSRPVLAKVPGYGEKVIGIPDYYVALGYIPAAGSNVRGKNGPDVFVCPVAEGIYGNALKASYWGGAGNTQSTYSFSKMMCQAGWNAGVPQANDHGPYRLDEIPSPTGLIFAGDGNIDALPGGAQYGSALAFLFDGNSPASSHIGAIFPDGYFGDGGAVALNPTFYQTYHESGPKALYWDGHVSVLQDYNAWMTPTANEWMQLLSIHR